MNTPIYDFVKNYSSSDISRLHMPGHKGCNILGCENIDITEIKGADSLYHADGIILQSEKNATKLFGSGRTFFSTEGSTHCIKSMVALAQRMAMIKAYNGEQVSISKIVALRNVHKSFINVCAILDLDVEWIFPDRDNDSICQCNVSIETIRKCIEQTDGFALYVTSPDYLGNMSDIEQLARICHDNNKLLLVDNAHGAYLKFLSPSFHPIDKGADMCCDSAHKSLPVLTGGAYLHISKNVIELENYGKDIMSLFGSTSPSYLILASLDLCNRYLAEKIIDDLSMVTARVDKLRGYIEEKGFVTIGNEKLKITIHSIKSGINGNEFADMLREEGVECEYSDDSLVVLMFSSYTKDTDYDRIIQVVDKCADKLHEITDHMSASAKKRPVLIDSKPLQAMSIRKAVFSIQERKKVTECEGYVCGMSVVSCPPAIPVVVSGEVITHVVINNLLENDIEEVNVVMESVALE